MAWAGYHIDEATKKQLQDAADMHAGNEPIRDVRDDVVDTEQIDWDAHKRFMRGL